MCNSWCVYRGKVVCVCVCVYLAAPAVGVVQHTEEEAQLTGQAELPCTQVVLQLTPHWLKKIQHLHNTGNKLEHFKLILYPCRAWHSVAAIDHTPQWGGASGLCPQRMAVDNTDHWSLR